MAAAALVLGPSATPLAAGADGCLVLLCLAAPNWRAVAQCVPPVRQVLHDLARGRPFPSCNFSGSGASAEHRWASAPGNCPPQYIQALDSDSGRSTWCEFTGAITVSIGGSPFTRTWWSTTGETVTEFTPAAKSQLGTWDTRYDDDYAAWSAAHAPAAIPNAN